MAIRAESLGQQHSIMPDVLAVPSDESHDHPRKSGGVFINDPDQPSFLLSGKVLVGGDVVEWTAEFPENLAYEGIAHFLNGFGATERSSHSFRHAAAEAGYATVTSDTARKDGKGFASRAQHPQQLHFDTLCAVSLGIEACRSEIRRKAPNGKDIDLNRKLLLPHSMAGLAATHFAEKEPNSVDAIINLATVGYGTTSLNQMARNVPRGIIPCVIHELLPAMRSGDIEFSLTHLIEEIRYFCSDVTRPVFEGLSCLRGDVRPAAERLQRLGVGILYLAFEHDILVSPDPKVAKYVDIHGIMAGAGHFAPQRKARKVMEEVVPMHKEYLALAA